MGMLHFKLLGVCILYKFYRFVAFVFKHGVLVSRFLVLGVSMLGHRCLELGRC